MISKCIFQKLLIVNIRFKKIISKIIEFENEKKRKLNIIDIGCGAGYISRAIAWLGHSVVG